MVEQKKNEITQKTLHSSRPLMNGEKNTDFYCWKWSLMICMCDREKIFSHFSFLPKKNHRPHKQQKWVNKRLTNKLEFFMVMMARSESCCTSHFTIPQEIANHICDEIWILSFPISPHAPSPQIIRQWLSLCVNKKCVSPWKKFSSFLRVLVSSFFMSSFTSSQHRREFFPATRPIPLAVVFALSATTPSTSLS